LSINPKIIGEFDDSMLAKYFGKVGYNAFFAPTILENYVVDELDV